MKSQYTRRTVLAAGGAVTAAFAGCVGGDENDSDADDRDENGSGDTGDESDGSTGDYDAYPFDVDVVDARHEPALEQLFEAMVLFGHTPDEEVDAPMLTGEFRGYYDDGEEYARLECAVEPTPDGERSLTDAIVTSTIIGQYAAEAENPPGGFDIAYYDVDGEGDDPFDVQSSTAEEAIEFWEDQDDDSSTDEPGDADPDEIENRDVGENALEFEALEITDHELVVETGEFRDEVAVEGIVENTGDEPYDYVEVGVRVYDAEGRQLDRYVANTTALDGGVEWAFEVAVLEDADDIDDYDIAVTGSQY